MSITLEGRQKKAVYVIIICCLLFLFMELMVRAYYYQQASNKILKTKVHSLALVQMTKDIYRGARNILIARNNKKANSDHTVHYLARPEWPRQEVDIIVRENRSANAIIYHPWLQFKYPDYKGKYVNVKDQVRRSVPDVSDSAANEFVNIYFLGGSTMYGYNVSDAETISAYFVEAYKKRYPNGKPIRVINMGVPFYYSYQELMLLTNNIFQQQIPDMVIMLDGLNDCLQQISSWWQIPFFTTDFQKRINPALSLYPEVPDYYQAPGGINEDTARQHIFNNYINAISNANKLAQQYHFQLYCFWQPVPDYGYPNRKNDPVCSKTERTQFEYIYPLVEEKAADLDYLFFLGNLLQHEKGLPFIDRFHYSPAFNKTIAEKMAESIPFEQ